MEYILLLLYVARLSVVKPICVVSGHDRRAIHKFVDSFEWFERISRNRILFSEFFKMATEPAAKIRLKILFCLHYYYGLAT